MSIILGISGYYHDSAAAIIKDGSILAAAQEERFTRIKHDASFPHNAIIRLLDETSLKLNEIDNIVFYDKPFLKFERLLETYVANAPFGFKSFTHSIPIWVKEKLFQKKSLIESLKKIDSNINFEEKLRFSEHHISHAASAFFPSPFEKALVLTIDGVGEWTTTALCIGDNNNLSIEKEIHFPHSLGLLYSAFTYYLGFKVNSGEYKVMGLAPYGNPIYQNIILDNLIDIKADGSFRLNQHYFDYSTGLRMTNKRFSALFNHPVRESESELSQFHMDVAASVQAVTETVLIKMISHLYKEYKIPNLCMAGGVALNCVANGKILKHTPIESLWVQPAAGDAGGAVGAALAYWHLEKAQPRNIMKPDSMQGAYLGTEYSDSDTRQQLEQLGAQFDYVEDEIMLRKTAEALAEGKAVGWFQGRMEFGPRALGGRSILADPRSETMQKNLNLKIKFRESFRPFAPSILADYLYKYFDLTTDSPYMLLVAEILDQHKVPLTEDQKLLFGIDKLNIKNSVIPAITHVDDSARIQTVHQDTNPMYHSLLQKFYDLTECPILVNTSFNVRGEPIVESPEDAFKCFMGTGLDVLVIGNHVMYKDDQNPALSTRYETQYELD